MPAMMTARHYPEPHTVDWTTVADIPGALLMSDAGPFLVRHVHADGWAGGVLFGGDFPEGAPVHLDLAGQFWPMIGRMDPADYTAAFAFRAAALFVERYRTPPARRFWPNPNTRPEENTTP